MWDKIRTNMQTIVLIAAFIGVSGTACAYFAKSADHNALAASYNYDKTQQRHNAVQERVWALEAECKKSTCSSVILEEIKHLKLELQELDRQLRKKS